MRTVCAWCPYWPGGIWVCPIIERGALLKISECGTRRVKEEKGKAPIEERIKENKTGELYRVTQKERNITLTILQKGIV